MSLLWMVTTLWPIIRILYSEYEWHFHFRILIVELYRMQVLSNKQWKMRYRRHWFYFEGSGNTNEEMRVNIQTERSHQKQILSTLSHPFPCSTYQHRLKHYRLVSMCHSRREGFHFQDVRVRFLSTPSSPRGPLVTSAVNSLCPINQQD